MRGRANGAFAVPVVVRGKRCNGALIPSTAAERSARLTPADGRDGRHALQNRDVLEFC